MNEELKPTYIEGPFASEDDPEAKGLKGWTELAIRGYGLEGDVDFARNLFDLEYAFAPEKESKIVALSEGEKVIASIVINRFPSLNEGVRTFNLHGIIVLPETTRKGIGTFLYQEVVSKFNVDVLVGSTKTPGAVIARAFGLGESGMRTFYGNHEVTSVESCGHCGDHNKLMENYTQEKGFEVDENFIFLRSTDTLLPNFPRISGCPQYIREAFLPLIHKQMEIGTDRTAVMPLLSIRADLL